MLEEEITADKLKEMLTNWFTEKENKQTLKTFVRNIILNKLIREDEQSELKFKNLILDNTDIALVYFVCDYLAKNHFHYSLSVFSSEISSTKLNEYVYDYFNKISYKWNTKKPPMLEYYTVHNILLTLNIDPASSVGSEIINRYYLLCEGSLLKVVASAMKSSNGKNVHIESNPHYPHGDLTDNSLKLQMKDPSNHKGTNIPSESHVCNKETFSYEVLEKYLRKKDLLIERRINSQKQEFSRCKRILLSCHDALITKLNEVYQLMGHINTQKNEIDRKLQVIENINVISKLLLEENMNKERQMKVVERVDKGVLVIETTNVQDNFTQTKTLIYADQFTETVIKKLINVGSQTDSQVDSSPSIHWQNEKLELLEFIDQQQKRIKSLTEKAVELTSKITSQQCYLPERDQCVSNVRLSSLNNPNTGLEEIIHKSDQTINKFNFNFELIKKKSYEAEKSYSHFLDTLLNS